MRLKDTADLIDKKNNPYFFEGLGLTYTSRTKAAKALNISPSTFARLEAGGKVSDVVLKKLALKLGQMPNRRLKDAKTWGEIGGTLSPDEVALLKKIVRTPKGWKEFRYAIKRQEKQGELDYPFGSVIVLTAAGQR